MATINFVGTYDPIVCGIGDYTNFITRQSPEKGWRVISFDLDNLGLQSDNGSKTLDDHVWYGIPSYNDFSSSAVLKGTTQLNGSISDAVLWFQHEHGIWQDDDKFVAMLSDIFLPKVVTLHTLHFQSPETSSGLRRSQHEFLAKLFPNVDAITVFSNGVYRAVTQAFPQYQHKVSVLRHGMHFRPDLCSLSRQKAKKLLHEYLIYDSPLDDSSKKALRREQVLLDTDAFVIGETGFLCPKKQSGFLYLTRDLVQLSIRNKRIAALRIGAAREPIQEEYARRLRKKTDTSNKFLLETRLPEDMLRIAQRAFDINLYWPSECSQSGILAHALGSGAMIAGRDLEGSGEILRESGAIAEKSLMEIVHRIIEHILCPPNNLAIEDKMISYARRYDWASQAILHYDLAEKIALSPGHDNDGQAWCNRGMFAPALNPISRITSQNKSVSLRHGKALGSCRTDS